MRFHPFVVLCLAGLPALGTASALAQSNPATLAPTGAAPSFGGALAAVPSGAIVAGSFALGVAVLSGSDGTVVSGTVSIQSGNEIPEALGTPSGDPNDGARAGGGLIGHIDAPGYDIIVTTPPTSVVTTTTSPFTTTSSATSSSGSN